MDTLSQHPAKLAEPVKVDHSHEVRVIIISLLVAAAVFLAAWLIVPKASTGLPFLLLLSVSVFGSGIAIFGARTIHTEP